MEEDRERKKGRKRKKEEEEKEKWPWRIVNYQASVCELLHRKAKGSVVWSWLASMYRAKHTSARIFVVYWDDHDYAPGRTPKISLKWRRPFLPFTVLAHD